MEWLFCVCMMSVTIWKNWIMRTRYISRLLSLLRRRTKGSVFTVCCCSRSKDWEGDFTRHEQSSNSAGNQNSHCQLCACYPSWKTGLLKFSLFQKFNLINTHSGALHEHLTHLIRMPLLFKTWLNVFLFLSGAMNTPIAEARVLCFWFCFLMLLTLCRKTSQELLCPRLTYEYKAPMQRWVSRGGPAVCSVSC